MRYACHFYGLKDDIEFQTLALMIAFINKVYSSLKVGEGLQTGAKKNQGRLYLAGTNHRLGIDVLVIKDNN